MGRLEFIGFFDELEKIATTVKVPEALKESTEKSLTTTPLTVPKKRRIIKALSKVRPYIASAVGPAVAGSLLGGLAERSPTVGFSKRKITGAAIGASLGLADQYIKEQSKKKGLGSVVKQYVEAGKVKTSAMAGDLRMKTSPQIKRPPIPTEGSKSFANSQLKSSKAAGDLSKRNPPMPTFKDLVPGVG